jgi:hypothetical protein
LFVAVIVYENGTQAWPVGVVELVMTGGGGLIVKVKEAVPVWLLLLVALSVTLYGLPASVPAAGVPEISPVVEFTVRPAGRPVALQPPGGIA